MDPKRFFYILRSLSRSDRYYVGVTPNVVDRLTAHNEHLANTARYRPWRMNVILEFATEEIALRFAKYFKSGSGRAFAKKQFE